MKHEIYVKICILIALAGLYGCKSNTTKNELHTDSTHSDTVAHTDNAHHEKHWSYEGETGPEHWSVINEEYKDCAGKQQSPVNIENASKDKTLKALQTKYTPAEKVELVNNGHTIQVNYNDGIFTLNNTEYHILQFHFHTPSEHTVNGEHFPMEVHFVHADTEGHLAVIGVLVKEGSENKFFQNFWSLLPKAKDEKSEYSNNLDITKFLPVRKNYYYLSGSLTTPPCTEGVQWFVMKNPVEASKVQIDQIAALMPKNNARPVQMLNDRKILEF